MQYDQRRVDFLESHQHAGMQKMVRGTRQYTAPCISPAVSGVPPSAARQSPCAPAHTQRHRSAKASRSAGDFRATGEGVLLCAFFVEMDNRGLRSALVRSVEWRNAALVHTRVQVTVQIPAGCEARRLGAGSGALTRLQRSAVGVALLYVGVEQDAAIAKAFLHLHDLQLHARPNLLVSHEVWGILPPSQQSKKQTRRKHVHGTVPARSMHMFKGCSTHSRLASCVASRPQHHAHVKAMRCELQILLLGRPLHRGHECVFSASHLAHEESRAAAHSPPAA